jgi:hypothetical protein
VRSTKTAEPWIEQGLGPFGPAALKPYSRTRFATDGSALLKIYVGIDPEGRRQREVATVERAALWVSRSRPSWPRETMGPVLGRHSGRWMGRRAR